MAASLLNVVIRLLVAVASIGWTAGNSRAEPAWTLPPPGYRYAPAPCPETGVPARHYRPCEDQMALLAAGLETARRENKLLLVKLGANWCPSCRAVHPQLTGEAPQNLLAPGTGLGGTYHVVEIAVSMLSGGRTKGVPSGEAVLDLLAGRQPGFDARAIPMLAVLDPSAGKAFIRHVDDLVPRGRTAPDPKQLADMLHAAARHIRSGERAPAEPGWLWRRAGKLLQ